MLFLWRIDDAVRRILTLKMKLYLFEHAMYPVSEYPDLPRNPLPHPAFIPLGKPDPAENENNVLTTFQRGKGIGHRRSRQLNELPQRRLVAHLQRTGD